MFERSVLRPSGPAAASFPVAGHARLGLLFFSSRSEHPGKYVILCPHLPLFESVSDAPLSCRVVASRVSPPPFATGWCAGRKVNLFPFSLPPPPYSSPFPPFLRVTENITPPFGSADGNSNFPLSPRPRFRCTATARNSTSVQYLRNCFGFSLSLREKIQRSHLPPGAVRRRDTCCSCFLRRVRHRPDHFGHNVPIVRTSTPSFLFFFPHPGLSTRFAF